MRLVRLPFSRSMMYHTGGIDKNLFKDMINLFPADAKIAGFGCDPSSNVDYIFVESAGFDDVIPGSLVPDGQVFFIKNPDGTATCDKIEWNNQYKGTPVHLHQWITYTGLHTTETTCKTCGVKKDEQN